MDAIQEDYRETVEVGSADVVTEDFATVALTGDNDEAFPVFPGITESESFLLVDADQLDFGDPQGQLGSLWVVASPTREAEPVKKSNVKIQKPDVLTLTKNSTRKKRGRKSHLERAVSDYANDSLSCLICLKEFDSVAEVNKHMSTHSKEKQYQCSFCPEMYNNEKNLSLHLALHTDATQCPECFKDFKRQASFKAHLIIHQVEDTVECPVCKEEFQYPFDRFMHNRVKHGILPFPPPPKEQEVSRYGCVKCSETYDTVKALREHLGTHSKVVKDALTKKAVKRKRTNKNDFCCGFCGKKFPKHSLLIRHERVHTGEKPFKCKVCGKNFNQSSTLKLHMRLHEDFKPFKCDKCNASFAQKVNLIAHVSSVHFNSENESVSCDICQRAFKKVSSLSAHYRRDHPRAQYDYSSGLMVQDVASVPGDAPSETSSRVLRVYCADRQSKNDLPATEQITQVETDNHTDELSDSALTKHPVFDTYLQATDALDDSGSYTPCLTDNAGTVADRLTEVKTILQQSELCENQPTVKAVLIHVEAQNSQFMAKAAIELSGGPEIGHPQVEFIVAPPTNRPILPKYESVMLDGSVTSNQGPVTSRVDTSAESVVHIQSPIPLVPNLLSQSTDGIVIQSSQSEIKQPVRVKEPQSTGRILSDAISDLINTAPDNSVGELAILDRLMEKNKTKSLDRTPSQPVRLEKRSLTDPITMRSHDTGSLLVGGVRYSVCLLCEKRFRKPIDLIRHLRSHNNEKPFKCKYCDQAFIVRSTLVDHERRHSEPQYECGSCGKKFVTAKGLRVHKMKHGSKCLFCSICGFKALDKTELDSHVSEHRTKANSILEGPIRIADGDKKGEIHYAKQNKSERKYRCNICPSSFVRSDHLAHHLRAHKGERPFTCDICDKSFSTRSLKLKHMTVHQTGDKVVCSVDGCGAEFESRAMLKRHQETHFEKKYLCPYCQEMFRTNSGCKKHILTHLGEVMEKGGSFGAFSELAEQSLNKSNQNTDFENIKEVANANPDESDKQQAACVTDFVFGEVASQERSQHGISSSMASEDIEPNTTELSTVTSSQIIFSTERSESVQNEAQATVHYEPVDISETPDDIESSKSEMKSYEQVDISERNADDADSVITEKLGSDKKQRNKRYSHSRRAYPPKKRLHLLDRNSESSGIADKETEDLIVVGSEFKASVSEEYRTVNLDESESANCSFVYDSEQFVVISENQLIEQADYTQQDTKYRQVAIIPDTEGGDYLIFVDENDQPVEPQDIFFNQSNNQVVVADGDNANVVHEEPAGKEEPVQESPPFEDKHVIGIEDDEKDETWSVSLAKRPKKALYKCKQCGRKFDHKRYREHKMNPAECVTMCSMCSVRFKSASAAAKHLEKVHSTKKCLICSAEFSNAGYFAQHVEKHKENGDNIFTCCELPFRDYEAFSEHFVSVHASQPVPEPTVVTVEIPSINHQDMATLPTQVKISLPPAKQKKNACGQCGSSFKKPSDLIRHMNSHGTEKRFLCTICDKRFRYKSSLTKHMEMHSKPSIECRKCRKLFYSYESLNSHIKICTVLPVCQVCGSSFHDEAEYELHMATHAGSEHPKEQAAEDILQSDYEAELGANTQIVNDIEYNLYEDFTEMTIQPGLIHSRQEDSKMTLKPAVSQSRLENRIFRRPVIQKPPLQSAYQCPLCEASFTKKAKFMRHKLIHDGVKPFKCTVCEASFLQKNGLEVHFRTHTGEKPFSCPFCDLRTAQLSNIRSHVSKKHGVDGKSMKASSFKRNLFVSADLNEQHSA